VFPTKQARGDSGKNPISISDRMEKKNQASSLQFQTQRLSLSLIEFIREHNMRQPSFDERRLLSIKEVFWLSTSVRKITCTKLKNMILEVGRNTQYRLAAVKGHTYELTRTHTLPKPVCCSLKCVSLPQVLRGSVVICLILPCVCVCVCVCVCLPPRPPVALRMFSDD